MVILGSTGSIGINAIEVAKRFDIQIEALVCNNNVELLNKQIKELNPAYVGIYDESALERLEARDCTIFVGKEEILDMLGLCSSKKILNAIVGFSGLAFSLRAAELDLEILLANKESLVIAGNLLSSSNIFPIDSEHFSLYTLLNSTDMAFRNLYITASGGALRDIESSRIHNATLSEVLAHPTWRMGSRITIDSATMVNKLYEILEAYWLFGTKNIDALIERNSLVHALVQLEDGNMLAHIGSADMRLPLSYGMLDMEKQRAFSIESIGIKELLKIDFQEISIERYPLWRHKDLLLENPHLGVVLNASNEYLQTQFLEEKIPFSYFDKYISEALNRFRDCEIEESIEDIVEIRSEVLRWLSSC